MGFPGLLAATTLVPIVSAIQEVAAGLSTEQCGAIALGATMGAIGLVKSPEILKRRQQVFKQELVKNGSKAIRKVPTASKKLVDHPLVAWAIENTVPWVGAFLAYRLRTSLGEGSNFLGRYWRGMIVAVFVEQFAIGIHAWVIERLYKHIPHFKAEFPEKTKMDILKDFTTSNLIGHLIVICFDAAWYYQYRDHDKAAGLHDLPFRPLVFLYRLIFVRILTDLAFYVGHYILHMKKYYFLHKRHHEQSNVDVTSNYTFSPADNLVEGNIPFFLALLTFNRVHPYWSCNEPFTITALAIYIFQLEITGHAGKPMPTMSMFPPIGLLMRKWDDWNSWFHTNHHRLLKCNYSVTPFWDWVFGTARY